MKILSTTSFIVLIGLVCLIQTSSSLQCIEYETPFDRSKTRRVDCPMVRFDKRQQPTTPDNMFQINFQCLINDQALCTKADNAFISAGKFITATLNLQQPVTVTAKFMDLCAQTGSCSATSTILGAAGPARLIPFQDPKDNKMRLYPQALFKQLNLQGKAPQLGPFDIQAMFNSNVTYWFEGDPLPMSERQVDMLYVVLHELVHGLGVTTAWNDYANIQALTPLFTQSFADPTKGQFVELITDRLLTLTQDGKTLTSIADELNQFQFTVDMTDDQIIQAFMASPQFAIAKDLFAKATTASSMGWVLADVPPNTQLTPDQIALSETSLVPYSPGSSVAHFDLKTYLNSSDFLMMFTYPKTRTLGSMMAAAGSTDTIGPIGPQLRTFLGIIGYQIKDGYTAPLIANMATDNTNPNTAPSNNASPAGPPTSNNKTPNYTSNDMNNSSLVSFNLGLSIVCILIALTSNIYLK